MKTMMTKTAPGTFRRRRKILLDVDGDEDENVARRAEEKRADETADRFDAGENAGLFAQRGHARRQNDLSGQPPTNLATPITVQSKR